MGGDDHALSVFTAVNPLITVVHQPTVLLRALFLPFRLDHSLVAAAVEEGLRAGREAGAPVRAVVAHLDVVRRTCCKPASRWWWWWERV